ncbi:MAG: acyltransferase [Sphingopyxis sp.]|nr:acyltransferase [Sphingopyxis sp.]
MRTGKLRGAWRKICKPSSYLHAEFLKIHGNFYHIGEKSRINVRALITDPPYVSIGDNCAIAACQLIGHNGVIGVLENAYNVKLDSVGKIVIKDNSFIGVGAIILPGVTIGPNSIVAAGAVVSRDVAPHTVVGGSPAKFICATEEYLERLIERSKSYPWHSLIETRNGDFDSKLESELIKQRVDYFFNNGE